MTTSTPLRLPPAHRIASWARHDERHECVTPPCQLHHTWLHAPAAAHAGCQVKACQFTFTQGKSGQLQRGLKKHQGVHLRRVSHMPECIVNATPDMHGQAVKLCSRQRPHLTKAAVPAVALFTRLMLVTLSIASACRLACGACCTIAPHCIMPMVAVLPASRLKSGGVRSCKQPESRLVGSRCGNTDCHCSMSQRRTLMRNGVLLLPQH